MTLASDRGNMKRKKVHQREHYAQQRLRESPLGQFKQQSLFEEVKENVSSQTISDLQCTEGNESPSRDERGRIPHGSPRKQ